MKGEGNQQDYGFRIYDPRVGRFLSTAPITKQYPELTPYQFASNRPIDGVDQDGLEWELSTEATRLKQRAQMETDVANAPARERARGFREAQQRAHGNVTGASGTPQRYGYDRRVHESNRVAILNLHGYNSDGSMKPLKALETNKTFENFADNIALPMVEGAALEGAGKFAFRGIKQLLRSSPTAADMARGWQGSGQYPGIDTWRNITLKEGTEVVGGLPGQSNYYTTMSGLNRSGGNAQKLWEGLQVEAHETFGYRMEVGVYRVTGNTRSAMGTTYANPQYGAGGLPQLYIPKLEKLELVKKIPLK